MPNRPVHMAVGAAVGGSYSFYCARDQDPWAKLFETVGGVLCGVPGGLSADWVDRPDNPNHRSFAHGAVAVVGLAYAVKNMENMQSYFRTQANLYAFLKQTAVSPALSVWYAFLEILMRVIAGAIAGFVAGYASHVILDFGTPESLPLIA